MKGILAIIGDFVNIRQRDILTALCMGLVAWSFYNIGRITGPVNEPVTVIPGQGSTAAADKRPAVPLDTRVVVSKSSTSKKYHYTWCSGANRIKEANKVWFETATAAQAAGYTLAGNCQ